MIDSIKLILISTQVEVGFELCNSSLHSLYNFIIKLTRGTEKFTRGGVGLKLRKMQGKRRETTCNSLIKDVRFLQYLPFPLM